MIKKREKKANIFGITEWCAYVCGVGMKKRGDLITTVNGPLFGHLQSLHHHSPFSLKDQKTIITPPRRGHLFNLKIAGEKEMAIDRSKKYPLFGFAWFPDFKASLADLKDLAMDEDWDYKDSPKSKHQILFNYLHYTFIRLREERKIVRVGSYAGFNTGLVTDNQEEIFALFKRNSFGGGMPYYFVKFCKESDYDIMQRFAPAPEAANYFSDPNDLIYDTRRDLIINIDHIIDDNISRFPSDLQAQSKHLLRNIVSGAIMDAKKRIKRNYKTAVPQYYKGNIQLLIPLCLKDRGIADLALVVRELGGAYRANTCLTLDMAFSNARLIAKPDDEWLVPSKKLVPAI